MNEGFLKSNALFDVGRRALDPTREDLDRTYEAVLSRAALAAAGASTLAPDVAPQEGSAPTSPSAHLRGGATRFAAIAKIGLAVLVLGLVGVIIVARREGTPRVLVRSDRSALTHSLKRASRAAPDLGQVATPAIDVRDLPAAKPSGSAPTRGAGQATDNSLLAKFEGKNVPASLAKELALMQKMAAAEHARRSAEALLFVRQHEKEFPSGVFREEREAIFALATCANGDEISSRAALQRFEAGYPAASLLPRVRKACVP